MHYTNLVLTTIKLSSKLHLHWKIAFSCPTNCNDSDMSSSSPLLFTVIIPFSLHTRSLSPMLLYSQSNGGDSIPSLSLHWIIEDWGEENDESTDLLDLSGTCWQCCSRFFRALIMVQTDKFLETANGRPEYICLLNYSNYIWDALISAYISTEPCFPLLHR